MLRFIFLIPIIFIVGCGIKQPIDVDIENIEHGSVFVNSNPTGALIFLDSVNTTKTTPDTLHDIPIGIHTIQVVKEEFRPVNTSFEIIVRKDSLSNVNFLLQMIEQFGYIFIQTTPAGSEIIIDNQSSGKITPDTIKVEPGEHEIELIKNGYLSKQWSVQANRDSLIELESLLIIQQRVLFESFANVSCVPCVDAAQNLTDFSSKTSTERFTIIEYFANWPSPNDPFYKVSPADVNKRVQYYSVAALPNLRINGTHNPNATEMSEIDNAYADAYNQQNSNIGLSISKNLIDGQLSVDIEIYSFNKNINSEDLKLFVAITEDDIKFDSPPGSNGLTDFEFVFRKFLSSSEGDLINTGNNKYTFNYLLEWPEWNYANSHVIGFIQNVTSKHIIQSSIN